MTGATSASPSLRETKQSATSNQNFSNQSPTTYRSHTATAKHLDDLRLNRLRNSTPKTTLIASKLPLEFVDSRCTYAPIDYAIHPDISAPLENYGLRHTPFSLFVCKKDFRWEMIRPLLAYYKSSTCFRSLVSDISAIALSSIERCSEKPEYHGYHFYRSQRALMFENTK